MSLTPEEQRIKYQYLQRLRQRILTRQEARILQELLERERMTAVNLGDILLTIGIGFLVVGLAGYIAENIDL